ERVAYRPVLNSKRLIALISAIGMSIFLQNYVSLTEGSRDVALPSLFNGQWVVGHSENFSASITTMQAVIWIVTFLAMLALTIFIRYSRMGRACRACAEDLKMASLLGINTDRVIAEALSSAYLSTEYKDVVSFALLILVLLVMPTGILGRPEVEKV
ncbi:MAG: branched-chain amino acid ABC transporter permease LivH, partial [Escherichia coli]|nr:branched-chain amino acid ABC transporter permease LivH [Escherichia coli]